MGVYNRYMTIQDFFKANNKAAIAFSGGVDSAYLLYAAFNSGADVMAYYVKSQFQPEFELEDAIKTAEFIGARMKVLSVDALEDPVVRENPPDRCYYCKTHIMGAITEAARRDGYELVCDGTNASDEISDRPGVRALREFGISSPLQEAGLTKPEIRELAKAAGIEVWNKPAYACLATRIPSGEEITEDKLIITEKAEKALFEMGYRDFRVRMRGYSALIQVGASQYEKAACELDEIIARIGDMYSSVTLDEHTR